MPIAKEPFRSYTLPEDHKTKPDIFSVRLSKLERQMVEQIKEDLNIKSDSKALKLAARIGVNVLHGTFGRPLLRYLFKKDRQKLSDFKNY